MAGFLPPYKPANGPATFKWGRNENNEIIWMTTLTIANAYDEITRWRKNVFLVPFGKIGRDFIDQLTAYIKDWNNGSENQHIALKAAFVLVAVCLQKPSQKSKTKDHKECLSKRLRMWKNGDIDCLIREGRMIQQRIGRSRKADPPNTAKIFAKLVMEGQINAALRYLSDSDSKGILPLTDDVMEQLHAKHPEPQEARLGSLLYGPIEDIPDCLYQQIDGEMIREAAARTKGSGGPSGVDAAGFKRILGCKTFKSSSTNLCDALADMTRKLCTEYIDPHTIEPLVARRLIPLNKGEGAVRPIGVGEVLRRIMAKCVMKILKQDVIDASGSFQVCAGLKCGSEAAIHAMREIFEAESSDAVLLVDASNAFNSLNRSAALHNVRALCPTLATFAINTYRKPARLFIIGGKEISSSEGTTQGDPIAMGLYSICLQPLISHLSLSSSARQCWFADDASASGTIEELKKWWEELVTEGPQLGYLPNAIKCWLIIKPEKEALAKTIFEDTDINISTEGHQHLGAVLGSRNHLEKYVEEKVEGWINEIVKLAEFAHSHPQASYVAYTFGLKHRWTYYTRTLPNIEDLLEPLERAISDVLIPSMIDHNCTQLERDILSLPVRLGGLGITNPAQCSDAEFNASIKVTAPLAERIMSQTHEPPDEMDVKKLQLNVKKEREERLLKQSDELRNFLPERTKRAVTLASEKGASNWLTVIPNKDMDFDLNKREFKDAINLRYDWEISGIPSVCACGDRFTVDHSMICKRGGFIIQRHNELRDLEAELLNLVCNDVETEPVLQELTGEKLNPGANTACDARLDIHARGIWERQKSTFFDIRVCHPNADSYKDLTPEQVYRLHENEKKRMYERRVLEVEQASFTPLVFTTTGGMGRECSVYHSRLAELISAKKGEDYAKTITWIRGRISFAILRSALLCLRGTRSKKRRPCNIAEIDVEVELANSRA